MSQVARDTSYREGLKLACVPVHSQSEVKDHIFKMLNEQFRVSVCLYASALIYSAFTY